MSETGTVIVPDEVVMNKIYVIRDQKVMLDRDLARNGFLKTFDAAN